MRTFLKGLIGIPLVIMLVAMILITVLYNTLTSPDFYKTTLRKTDFYNSVNATIVDTVKVQLSTLVNDSIEEQTGKAVDLTGLTTSLTPLLEDSVDRLITPEVSQLTVENNLDNFFEYFNGEANELSIYVPKSHLVENIKVEAPNILANFQATFVAIPDCSFESLETAPTNENGEIILGCLPPELKADLANSEAFSFLNNIDEFIAEFEKNNTILAGGDEISLDEFIEASSQNDPENGKTIKENIENAQEVSSSLSLILLIGWFPVVILLLLFILVTGDDIWHRLVASSALFFIAGLILLIPSSIFKFVVDSESVVNKALFSSDSSELPSSLITTMTDLLLELISQIVNPLFTISLIITIISLALVIVFHLLGRDDKGMKVTKVEETKVQSAQASVS